MVRTSLSVFGSSVMGVLLLAACSATSSEDGASASSNVARGTPGEELLVLPPMPMARIAEVEDKDAEHNFAESSNVAVTPATAGVWDEPSPGIRRWRFSVEREGALSQNLGFGHYDLPAGARLRLLDATGREVASFTDRDNKGHGELWTPIVLGTRATVEVTVPKALETFVDLSLTQVNSAFRDFGPSMSRDERVVRSGECNRDVVCADGDGWRNEIASVAVISIGGRRMCTGTLLNDATGSGRPFFLTAAHCRVNASNAASLVVYWNYQTSSCGGRPDGQLQQFSTGATFRAARAASDFTLVELNEAPKAEFEVFYSGWDARPITPNKAIGIHHPNTDEKRISFENDPLSVTTYLREPVPGDGTHLRVTDWDVGTTEPGSSGSGLWNEEHRLVGQLHGGYASCSSQTSDWYGWFNRSFEAGSTPAERAKDWLDATATGAQFVDGTRGCTRPSIEFTTTPNLSQAGQEVTATATVTGEGPFTYAWDMNGDGLTDCTTETCSFTYSAAWRGMVTLSVTSASGCTGQIRHEHVVSASN